MRAMETTRWMWVPKVSGRRLLAFSYVDPSAGPSARGAAVSDPPTEEEIRQAIEAPDRTVRDPARYGAVSIGREEAARLDLPEYPAWFAFSEGLPIPPPRGRAPRVVRATVTMAGRAVAGAAVQLGQVGNFAEAFFMELDRGTTDEHGRCVFAHPYVEPIALAADAGTAKSKVTTAVDGKENVLELIGCGVLEGEVRRAGELVDAMVRINAREREGGVTCPGWTTMHGPTSREEIGKYRIDGILPGTYDVEVNRYDPRTFMTAGVTTTDTIVVESGARLRRDYAVVAGTTLAVVLAVENDQQEANVMIFKDRVQPRTSIELRELWQSRASSEYRASNMSTNDGRFWRTEFLDVERGVHTLCIAPSDLHSRGTEEQLVVCREVIVDDEPLTIELTMPSLRLR
jgi:hypothetical protein